MGNEQSEQYTLPETLSAEFSAVHSDHRVDAVMEMVKLCPYPQQLQILEELQKILHKDFITALPPNLSEKVISYFSIDDARNCLLVCKSWTRVVGDCSSYWQTHASKIGLSDAFLQQQCPDNRGLKDLCIAALNHKTYVKSLITRAILLGRCPADNPNHSYLYAGSGVALRYEEINSNTHSQVVIEHMNTPHSMAQVASFNMHAFSSRVKWVAASDSYILWKQIDGMWNGCSTRTFVEAPDQWQDDPVSQGFHTITFCRRCHLVAILTEAEDDCEVWDLQVIKLVKGQSTPRKSVYPLPLDQMMEKMGEKKRHFLGGDVMLLPESREKDSTGFCKAHRVLLQIDNCVAIHRLESITDTEHVLVMHQLLPDAKLSKPLHILCPRSGKQSDDFSFEVSGGRGPPAFCLSADRKRMGVMYESYLYMWNLTTFTEESSVDLIDHNLPSDTKCIAIGSVYAILASNSWGTCSVISTTTGEIQLFASLGETSFNPSAYRFNRFKFYPPVRQDWLSAFEYFDFWPLALVFDSFAVKDKHTHELELQVLMGVRRHQNHKTWMSLGGLDL